MNCIVILEHITLPQLRIIIYTCYLTSVVLVYDILIMTPFFIKIHRKDKINDNQIMFDSASLRSLPDFYRFVENWFGFILIHDKYRLNVKICWECKFVGDEYPRNQQKLSTTNINNSPVSCPISRSFSIIFSKLYNTVGYYRTSREERAKVYRVR